MDEHEIRDRPKFESRVITPPDMTPFESTVAQQLDVLHQSTDALWTVAVRANNIAVQVERKIKPMLDRFMAYQLLLSLIPIIAATVAIYLALRK